MLLCKACNTRFEDGRSACPSCGRRVFASVPEGPKHSEPDHLPPPSASRTADEDDSDLEVDVDVELGEVDVLAEAVDPAAARDLDPPAEERKRAAPVHVPRPESRPPAPARPRSRRSLEPEPGPAVFHLSAAQVRTLVAEQPALIARDLALYRDAKKGVVGVDFRTPVGSIDVLARDANGDFVVVSIPDLRDVDTLMPEMLARIGWVRKHLATERKAVRGIVVIEEIPEELAYAAAGVAQTISFMAYRVALTFHPLPL
jgi:predicted  nucleic acid-binding Zn-ribbon protein